MVEDGFVRMVEGVRRMWKSIGEEEVFGREGDISESDV